MTMRHRLLPHATVAIRYPVDYQFRPWIGNLSFRNINRQLIGL